MTGERMVFTAIIVICLALLWRGNGVDPVDDRADEIALIEAQRDSASERADSLTRIATRADSAVAAVRDSAASVEVQTRTVLVTQLDTIRVLVQDTTVMRMLDDRDGMWQGIVDGKDSVITEQAEALVFWRGSSFAKDTVIARDSVQLAIQADVNDALRAHIRGQKRRSWLERSAAVAAVVLVATR